MKIGMKYIDVFVQAKQNDIHRRLLNVQNINMNKVRDGGFRFNKSDSDVCGKNVSFLLMQIFLFMITTCEMMPIDRDNV